MTANCKLLPFLNSFFKPVFSMPTPSFLVFLLKCLEERYNNWCIFHLPESISYSGLGLKNVQRRLFLVYKDTHSLIITKSKDVYTIKLQLTLADEVLIPLKKISI